MNQWIGGVHVISYVIAKGNFTADKIINEKIIPTENSECSSTENSL
jgi:hypothetical protein